MIVLAGLVGAITWNVLTWLLGLPSSSSHALFGGLIGATVAGLGWSAVNWTGDGTKLDGVIGKVILPAVMSPVLAALVAALGTWLVFKVIGDLVGRSTDQGFRWGQIGSASLVSLAHGTNDAQKTMGVITLALIASGHWSDTSAVPVWVKLCCALAISLGTFLGGWRIIRTVGKGWSRSPLRPGMAAESSSAALILVSSQLGLAAVDDPGRAPGRSWAPASASPAASCGGDVAGRMVVAWCITMPAAGLTRGVHVVARQSLQRPRRRPGHDRDSGRPQRVDVGAFASLADRGGQRQRRVGRAGRPRAGRDCGEGLTVMQLFWDSAWKVVIWSVVLGAGLPALFAVGVRTTVLANAGRPGLEAGGESAPRTPGHRGVYRVIGVVCFALVVAAVVIGLTIIAATGFGKEVSFEHVYPTVQPKP